MLRREKSAWLATEMQSLQQELAPFFQASHGHLFRDEQSDHLADRISIYCEVDEILQLLLGIFRRANALRRLPQLQMVAIVHIEGEKPDLSDFFNFLQEIDCEYLLM